MHIVEIISNESSVPYFSWFAKAAQNTPGLKLSFIALHKQRPKMLNEMRKAGWDCHWIFYDDAKRKRGMISVAIKLYFLFRRIKPDIVHTHLFDDSLPALFAAKRAGVKGRIITKQDTGFHWFYAPRAVHFDRMNNRNATHIVAVSEECRRFIIEKEQEDVGKITLIHHGIPFETLTAQSNEIKRELTARFGLQDKTVIGTVARLIDWKGYRYIIEAAKDVVRNYPNVRFLFIGEGDQKEELQQLAERHSLTGHIIFTGWIDRAYVPSLYGIMDIYLHAASYEPFGFVIAEAMANGIPVVSAATGSALDAIEHKVNGYLTPHKDAKALAEGICFMMETDRKKIGEAGKKKAQEMFSFSQMWEKHLLLYQHVYDQLNGRI